MDSKLLRLLIPALLAGSIPAQTPPRGRFSIHPYFPLAVGNQWIYVQRGLGGGEPLHVQIISANQFNGLTYHHVIGYAERPAWVRHNSSGELVQYDSSGRERLWYPFAAPDGSSFRTEVPSPCLQQAVLRTRNAEVRVPAGSFSPHVAVEFQPGPCADAGYSEEIFASGVGMVRRTAITIAGPRTFELIWARVGGALIGGPELSFQLAIDRPVYVANLMPPVDPVRSVPVLTARFTARNTSSQPVTLQFRSGQRYDLVIRDSTGRQVFQWSEGRAFTMALGNIELKEGDQTFVEAVRLADRSGRPLPEGRYTLEAWLATTQGKLFSATVPFEIQHAF